MEGSGLELISRLLCGGTDDNTNNSLKTASRCPGRDMNRGITDSCTEHTAILWHFLSLMYVCMGERRDAYAVLVGKPEGKRPLARPTRRWDYNIEVHLKNICWEGVGWSELG